MGNVLYLIYTIILAVLIIGIAAVIFKRRKTFYRFLIVSIVIFIISQMYFWTNFNVLAKSYVSPSKQYTCDYYKETKDLSIPLPNRTVYMGKEDVCSPFYTTYASDEEFTSLYDRELKRLKNNNEIASYASLKDMEDYKNAQKGYHITLSNGINLTILLYHKDDDGSRTLLIKDKK